MDRSCKYGLLCIGFLLMTACGQKQEAKTTLEDEVAIEDSGFSSEEFESTLKSIFPATDTLSRQKISSVDDALALTYQLAGYQPLWLNALPQTPEADALIEELESLKYEGIDVARYNIEELKNRRQQAAANTAGLTEAIRLDTLCTKMYLKASRELLLGLVSPAPADVNWHHSNDSEWIASKMLAGMSVSKTYPGLNTFLSNWPVNAALRDASKHYWALRDNDSFCAMKQRLSMSASDSALKLVINEEVPWIEISAEDSLTEKVQLLRGYQYYFGQKLSGKLDSATLKLLRRSPDSALKQIAVNQERLRWMNQKPEATHIFVPLALMELFLIRDGQEAMHMRTVIGKPGRSTPSLNADMVNVVINPPWGVPPTILKNDVAPGISKRGGAYLAKKGLKAYDRKGKLISSSKINGTNYKRFDYRQDPGARNALGVIKFNLPNPWDIYLHDTPHKEDFPNRNRAKSSGCIRLQHPRNLGVYILQEMEGNERMNGLALDSIVLTRKTQYHKLKSRIPVHIVYLTAYTDSTNTHLRQLEDIYKRDNELGAKL